MPSGFSFPSASIQLWTPFGIDRADPTNLWATFGGSPVGRLRRGVSLEQAAVEVGTLAPQMRELFPWSMPESFGSAATVVPLREQMVGDVRPAMLVLLGAVGFVLLIACANVANLLLARATTRRQEMAIRAAMGAGRGRMIRQVLTESLVLAGAAGIAGLLLGAWGTAFLAAGLPADTPRVEAITVDSRVLSVALGLTLVTGLLLGMLPAVRASGIRLSNTLKEGGRSGRGMPRRRLSGSLVAGEMALSIILVIGAMLLIRSFWELSRVDPGFRTEGLVTATVAPPTFRYEDDAATQRFYHDLLERLQGLPGVVDVAATDRLPFGATLWEGVFAIEGRPDPATEGGDWPAVDIMGSISEDYLTTMGIPLLEGRTFTEADREGAPPVVLVSQGLAREYWPDETAVGKRVRFPGAEEWETIVGVIGDTRSKDLAGESNTAYYRPLRQWPPNPAILSVVLRTSVEPGAIAPALRETVRSVDRDTPVSDIRSMSQLTSSSVAERRFTIFVLAAFAGAALLLGAIGIYGVLVYAVNERSQEIGIRMALGAHPSDVLRLVLREGALVAGVGIVIGLVGAAAGSRVLSSLLYGVTPTDGVTFAAAPAFLLGVALLASYLPARRATRVDPMIALRAE